MKKQIRFGVFETNSSSTHSLTMCSSEDYGKWKKGELIFDRECDELVPITDEVKKQIEEDGWGFETYNQFFNDEYLEAYSNTYTTKSGDEIVAFGKFGYDG